MEKVEQYLREMTFKKRILGGVDEERALLHIKKISELYQAEIEENYVSQETLAVVQEELEQQKTMCAALQVESVKARHLCDEWKKKAEDGHVQETEQLKQEYKQKYNELSEAINTIQTVKKEAVVQAQVKAAQEATKLRSEILSKAAKERRSVEEEVQCLRREADALRRRNKEIQQGIETEQTQWLQLVDKLIGELQSFRQETQRGTEITITPLSGILGNGWHAG